METVFEYVLELQCGVEEHNGTISVKMNNMKDWMVWNNSRDL